MQAIQSFLDELHRFAAHTTVSSAEALAVASDLRAYLKEVSDSDMGMCSSLLFESPVSILNLLLKTTQNKDLAKAKEELLDLLLDYLKQIGPKGCQTFAIPICDACFTVFRSDQTSKVKTMCLPIIIKLIHMKVSSITAETLRVQNKVETLLTELSYSRNTQSVKGGILQTLGVFAEYFPEQLVRQSKTLLVMLSDLLSDQFKDKKPDYQVIEGGMRGLISLLVHFSGEVTGDSKKIASIWRFTLACLNPPEGMKTYAIPKAGLVMVEKHAELFKQYLTEKASVVYPLIKTYCTHGTNRAIRKFGFGAMEAFLMQVAREIVSEDRTKEANMATLRFFFEEFWSGLQERNSGLLASSVFVRGFGIFARSIDFYMGPTEVKKMLHKLIVFSSRFYDPSATSDDPSSGVDAEETIEHMPSILGSYANIITELPEVDEVCIDALERILGTFFLVYPQLYELQRFANYRSIARLLLSLHSKGAVLQTLLSRIIFKGLVLTCSKPVQLQQATANSSSPAVTEFFYEYQDLWRNFIDIKPIHDLQLPPEIYADLSALVYKELMQASIKMLRKLDLRYSVVKESEINTPLTELVPVVDLDASVSLSLTQTQGDVIPMASLSDDTVSPMTSSLPSSFGSSMDIDSSSQTSQTDVYSNSPISSPNRRRREKPVANIDKNEFSGCAKTILPGETIKPWVPKDFELFLHLVEFMKLFLPSIKPKLFGPWVYLFCKEVLTKSTDYPLISGLYKLLGVSLQVCSTIRFFNGIGSKGMLILNEQEQTNASNEQNTKRLCFKLITAFVRELLLRLRQYRDELLASCIQTVLSIPKEFLEVQTYTPCLIRAFKMGLAFLPLTEIGLTSLESWHQEQPEALQSVLHLILPVLNPYLYITKEEAESNLASNERFAASNDVRSWVFGYGANKPNSATTKDLAATAAEYRPEHSMALQANLQVRILRLLGKLGGANTKVISDVDGQMHGVAWDSTPRVAIDLMFAGGILKLYLDDLLPTLCHLAASSSNRQTKISACEFVHAICMNLTNQDDGKGANEAIYQKLFPIVVQLASDVEKITRQLFEPLVLHLIKWSILTGSDKATNILLLSLAEALSSDVDGALRSFAASSLTQFLKMFFDLKRGKQSVVTLFSLLHSLACHPNPYSRLGAVMAFHQLTKVIQQHKNDPQFDHAVIQPLEIMNSLFSALQLTKSENIGIETQALQVIEQLGVIIQHFSETLLSYGLSPFVTNLFVTYCAHVRKPVRNCAQALFLSFVRLLPTNPTPAQWLKNRTNGKGEAYDAYAKIVPKVEKAPSKRGLSNSQSTPDSQPASQDALFGSQYSDSPQYSFSTSTPVNLHVLEGPDLVHLLHKAVAIQKSGSLDPTECLTWFSGLSAWMDALLWLLTQKIIGTNELTKTAAPNPIFQHLLLFLKVYAMMDLSTGYFASMTAQEMEAHTQARCNATLSTYALASCLIDNGALNLAVDALYRNLIVSMLAPHLLGFPLYNAQDQRRVRKATTKLVSTIVRRLSVSPDANVAGQEAYTRFCTCTSGIINRAELNVANLTFTPGQIDVEKMRYIATGLYDLHRIGVLASRYKNFSQLPNTLLTQVFQNHATCTPLELAALRKVVKLALSLPFEATFLLELLKDTSRSTSGALATANEMQTDQANASTEKSNRRQLSKGELFYSHFKTNVDEYFSSNIGVVLKPLLEVASTSHPQMFKMVIAIVDILLSDVKNNRASSARVDQVLEHLSAGYFMSWTGSTATHDDRDNVLEYVKKMLTLCGSTSTKHAKAYEFVLKTFESFMSKDQPLWFKNRMISLLRLSLTRLPLELVPRILKPVEYMIVYDFPSTSSLLTPDSAAYSEYIGSLDILLNALSSTFSVELLETLFPILNDSKHVHMLSIDKALDQFVKGVKPENAQKLFEICFTAFVDATPNLESLRLALIRKICVPFIMNTTREACMTIMKEQANKIMGLVFPVLPEITTPKPDSKAPIVDRLTVIGRIGAFHLIQAMFSALPQADRDELNSFISVPKEVNKAGSLSQKAMKCAFSVRNKKHAEYAPDVTPDIVLEYQRAAYHCLATVLMKAQPANIKFFEVFGFGEDLKKGDLLWEHIVDLDTRYAFSVETHFPIANKQVSAIYSKASQKHVEPTYSQPNATLAASGAVAGTLQPRRYSASSYFADSSLSQDVSDSAFFMSSVQSENKSKMDVDGEQGPETDVSNTSNHADSSTQEAPSELEEIELDPLNTNPCMFNMLDMIDDMYAKFGDALHSSEFMPVWMTELHNKMARADTPLNVRLFITKLIMNKPETFERFASDWFAPLCRVLLYNVDTVGVPGFNYFVRDMCIVFLRWSKFVPHQAEQKMLAAQFMEYLIRNATHHSRSVITSNLQIIRLLVERWKDSLMDKVPRKLLLDMLTLDRKSARASRFYRLVGIQIIGIMVSNKMGLWNDQNYGQGNQNSAISRRDFLSAIVSLLNYTYKEVYQATGELIGLAFLLQSPGADEAFHQMVSETMTIMFNGDDLVKFIAVLERLARHYPVIIDSFMERIMVSIKKLGENKAKALDIILLRIASMSDPYAALASSLDSLIRHRDDDTQLAILNVLHVIYGSIPAKVLPGLVTELAAAFSDHTSEAVRSRYLELLMQLYDDRRNDLASDDRLRLALLKGLADSNPDISGALFEFWDRDDRLPTLPSSRLHQLMLKFYHPDVETHWLKISAHLMLRLFKMHKSFEAVVSTLVAGTDAADIVFDDSTTKMAGIMEPSAATYVKQTLSESQMMDTVERTSPAKRNKDAYSRYHTLYFETLGPAPSATAAPEASQASSGTGNAAFKTPKRPAKQSGAKNPTLTDMGPPKTPPPRNRINAAPTLLASPPSTFMETWGGSGAEGEGAVREESKVRVTRRFAQSPIAQMGSSHFFRQKELANRKQREAQARELARKRLHHVQLHREYGAAIKSISNKDIVAPLLSVALRNDGVSRLVLAILVNAMRDQIDAAQLQSTLGKLLESSLSGNLHSDTSLPSAVQTAVSSSISTPFISCLLRIAHDHPSLVLPARLIADCSVKSLNFHLGITTLENQILKHEKILSGKPAGRGLNSLVHRDSGIFQSPLIDDAWAQLVRLYKLLGEEDILRGLYEKPSLTTRVDLKMALKHELEGEFAEAYAHYSEILQQYEGKVGMEVDGDLDACTENELEICNAGQLACLAKMSNWKQLSSIIYEKNASQVGPYAGQSIQEVKFIPNAKEDPLAAIWTPSNREKYMRYFMTACLMERERWGFVFEWMDATIDKRSALEGEFSSELAYLSVLRNDLGRADSYVRQSYRHFLASWSVLPPSMASSAQLQLLQRLQPLLELEEYLTFATNPENFSTVAPMHKILELWRNRYPSQRLDDFEVWERVGRQRGQYLNLICTHYMQHKEFMAASGSNSTRELNAAAPAANLDINYIKKVLKADRDHLNIKMSIAARKQHRLEISHQILSSIEAKLPKGRPPSFVVFIARLKTDFAIARHQFGVSNSTSKAHTIAAPTKDIFEAYAGVYERLLEREAMLSPESIEQLAEVSLVKSKLLLDVLDMQTAHPSAFSTAWKQTGSETRNKLSFVGTDTLREVGKKAFETVVAAASADANSAVLAKTHFKFARFCDKIAATLASTHRQAYLLDSVRHMFKAIRLGHPEAIGSVPLILRILSSTRNTAPSASKSNLSPMMKQMGELFTEQSKLVPSWIWLRWLNQLMGLMDHPEFTYVLPILEGVAEAYPQSLYYHFRISTDKDFGTRPVEARLSNLHQLLRNDLLDKFVDAMDKLTNPEHRAKAWMSAMNLHFSNPMLLNKLYRAFVEDCLIVTPDTGDLNRHFASKIPGRDLRERGSEGSAPADKELIKRVHAAVTEACSNFTAISDKANTLGQYTKWLDSYASVLGAKVGDIEIPGQYTGLCKPQPEHHVKVSSFDKSLLIMASMRRPKRLKIRGTDEKEYWFLVKGGEDLRQDQRVEQLFDICNSMLAMNIETSKRNLSIHTYSVIPMTTRAGILEWIRNTQPLKAVIDAQNHPGFKHAVDDHDKFLGRTAKTKVPIQDLYKAAFRKADLAEVEKKLARQHEYLPSDLLRSKIIALSADPEAFLGIRQRAATSIAVFSVVSYIIGIGDRHLDNFLINLKDGEFIGIDFGYAFDAATLLLPIPEMVPFRLTRQMTQLLKPLDSDGLLKLTIIHTLGALVKNKHLLLDAMDVFVNEPLLDWSMWANKLPGKPSIEAYTRDRLKTVEHKLSLYDPGFITAQLLKVSIHHAEDYRDTLIKIVSPKAGQPRQCPTIRHQAERLIEQATNPHILGMAWAGWCPWV
jgi:DNA-dependent protein kinase catalytic subunit